MSPQTNMQAGAEVIGGYTVHPTASLFPLLEGKGFDELKQSIRAHGQQEPIIVRNRVLIDGRNRLKVLLELSRQPVFAEYEGKLSVEEFILVKNLFRRHLTDDQRAMITARAIYPKEAEAAREREKTGKKQPLDPGSKSPQGSRAPKVTEKIAEVAKVTDYQARQTSNVIKHAPELVGPVANGKVKLKDADREAQRRKVVTHRAQPHGTDFMDTKTRIISRINDAMKKFPQKRSQIRKEVIETLDSWADKRMAVS